MTHFLTSIFLISGRGTGVVSGLPPAVNVVFLALSCGLLVAGIIIFQKRRTWLTHSQVTQGKVVDYYKRFERHDHSGMFPMYFPIVTFQANGKQFVTEANKGTQDVHIGDEIPVRYNEENPEDSVLGSNNIPGLQPGVFLVFGTLLLSISIVLMALK
jgi:Protein of unknown function (DUF3592)